MIVRERDGGGGLATVNIRKSGQLPWSQLFPSTFIRLQVCSIMRPASSNSKHLTLSHLSGP